MHDASQKHDTRKPRASILRGITRIVGAVSIFYNSLSIFSKYVFRALAASIRSLIVFVLFVQDMKGTAKCPPG